MKRALLLTLLLLAWIAYTRANLHAEIAEFDRLREENKASLADVDALQKEFDASALKIEKAAKIVSARKNFGSFIMTSSPTSRSKR